MIGVVLPTRTEDLYMKIGVVLPTRGLVFTRVEEALEDIRRDHDLKIYRSHDLPIPDGHNLLVKQALEDGCDYIWMVEEDTVPVARSLESLLQVNSDIACIDYGVSGWGCITRDAQDEILWCGLGCTLIKSSVFLSLDYPWFRVDKTLSLNTWTWMSLPDDYVAHKNYGTLDIWFCCQAREKGFKIVQVEGECDHLKLDHLGEREANHGLHQISLKPRITKKQTLQPKEVN